MADDPHNIIVLAQAEGAAVTLEGEHADEAHATTEDHGGDHSGVFPPFDPASFGGQLLWLAITFGALYLLMSRVALPRIGGILEMRQARIDGDLAEAALLQAQADAALKEYETSLASARQNARTIAEATRESIKAETDGRRKTVEADLQAQLKTAETSITASKTTALANVGAIAAETTQAVLSQLSTGASDEDIRNAVAQVTGAAR